MAFTANEIKNLALMELNHETISDWTDTSNTDISIINTQYALAKSVALTMYQWSWAFKYAKLSMYEYAYDLPSDWVKGSSFTLYTDSTMQETIDEYSFKVADAKIYVNASEIYLDYVATGDVPTQVALTGTLVSDIIGKYKKAAFLPDDFAGYLSCYTNKCQTVLADYVTVGDTLYTNADELNLKYIGEVDESVFPAEFVDWFKIFIAQRLNGYLNGDMQRQQLLTGEEPFFFRKAKNIDSKRNKHDSLSGNPLLWIRGKIGGAV